MVDKSGLWGCFLATWELTMDPPLPKALRLRGGRRCAAQSWCFPLLGALLGGAVACCGWLVSGLFNPIAGAFVFAILGTALWELKDSGRETALLFSFLARRGRGVTTGEALERMTPGWGIFQTPQASMLLVAVELLRFALLFSLSYYDAKLWMWVMVSGVFTVQGYLALCPRHGGGAPLLGGGAEARRRLWTAFAAVMVVVLWSYPLAAPVAALLAVLTARETARFVETNFGGVSPDVVTLAGGFTGYILLVAGIFFSLTVK